jgi:hypothetical protein
VWGSSPGGGRDLPYPSRPALGPTQPPTQCVPGLSPGLKRSGRGVDHPPTSSAEAEGRVELYIYSRSGPSWPILGKGYLYLYLYQSINIRFKDIGQGQRCMHLVKTTVLHSEGNQVYVFAVLWLLRGAFWCLVFAVSGQLSDQSPRVIQSMKIFLTLDRLSRNVDNQTYVA